VGGVLSPVLFCLCVDDLLFALSKRGVGYFIDNNCVGALAYADDIVLVVVEVELEVEVKYSVWNGIGSGIKMI